VRRLAFQAFNSHDPLVGGERTVFPWQRLDGRPLIYTSMGTLRNRLQKIFETIAEACAGLDAQLVLSLGSRDDVPAGAFAGAPVVVPFAPQIDLLKRAALTITHAGLNTALESFAHLNGLARAADIVEQAISKRQPVLRNFPRARPGP
jgi:UDP:flavonoid glycosyltransferase YjiC (YdhE family)